MTERYNAGTIFLQVVPVFGDLQRSAERATEDYGKALAPALEREGEKAGKAASDGIGKGLAKGADKDAEKYAGAFLTRLRGAVREAGRELPAIQMRLDDGEIKNDVKKLQKELRSINRTKIKPDMDVDGLLERVAAAKAAVESLGGTEKVDIDFNFAKMAKDLAKIEALIQGADAEVEVEVKVDRKAVSKFETSITAAAKRAQQQLDGMSLAQFEGKAQKNLAKVKATIQSIAETDFTTNFDAAKLVTQVEIAEARLKKLAANEYSPDLELDLDESRAALRGFLGELEAAEKRKREINFGVVDTQEVKRELGALEAMMRDSARRSSRALASDVGGAAGEVRRALAQIGDESVDIDTEKARADLIALSLQLRTISKDTDVDIFVRADAAKAYSELLAVRKAANLLDGKDVDLKVDVDAGAAYAQLGALGVASQTLGQRLLGVKSGSDQAANSFRSFNVFILAGLTLLPALIPVIGALGGALVALIPVFGAVVGGLGAMFAAFSGIGDAVSAMGAVSDEQATRSTRMAETEKSNAASIEAAQRSLGKARTSAAKANANAEKQVGQAQKSAAQANAAAARQTADARQSAARSIRSALESQADAEKSLADAQREARQAQQDLTEARREARKDLERLADDSKQNALDERQAVIDLFNARVDFDATMADGASTNLDKEQADIGLESAKLRLKRIRDEKQEIAKQRKEGIEGTDRVQTAQDALTQALERQKDAQEAVGDAAKAVNQARIDGARQVADAVRSQRETEAAGAQSVADAVAAQRETEVSGAEQVVDAARNLKKAQDDAKKAMLEASGEGSAAMEKLELAMGKLSPAGRDFAKFIFGLQGAFRRVRNGIQQGLLPPLQNSLDRILDTYGDRMARFAVGMGITMGSIFTKFGTEVTTNPVWDDFMSMMEDTGSGMLADFGEATINWLTIFANLITIAAPYGERLAAALLNLSERTKDWMASAEGNEWWTDFLDYAFRVGPKVVDFFVALWGAAVNLAKALAPMGEATMGALTVLLGWIAGLDTDKLGQFVTLAIGLGIAFQLAVGAVALITAGMTIMASPLALAVFLVAGLAAVLFSLYLRSETARAVIDGLIGVLKGVWNVVSPLVPVLTKVAAAVLAIVVIMRVWRGITALMTAVQLGFAAATYGAAGATYAQGAAAKIAFVAGRLYAGAVGLMTLMQNGLLLATLRTNIAMGIAVARIYAQAAAMKVVAVAARIWAGAQWLLNAAMSANPLGLIIVAIVALVAGFIWAYKKIDWFRNMIDGIVKAVVGFFVWLWDVLFGHSIIPDIVDGFMWAVGAIGKILGGLWTLAKWVYGVFMWLWEKAIKPYLTFVLAFWKFVFKAMAVVWNTVLWPVIKTIARVVWWLWKTVFKVVFTLIAAFVKVHFLAIKWAWTNILKPVFDAVAKVLGWLWRKIFRPTFKAIGDGWRILMRGMKEVWNKVLRPVFQAIWEVVLPKLKSAFDKAIDAIKSAWDKLRDIIAAPIRWVVETVINGMLIKAFNKVAEFVGADPIEPIKLGGGEKKKYKKASNSGGRKKNPRDIGMATGGVLPGYTPGRDVHHFVSPTGGGLHLSGGEAIMRPEWTRAMGGPREIERQNKLAKEGKLNLGRFATGGVWHPGPRSTRAGHGKSLDQAWDINSPGGTGTPVRAFLDGLITTVADTGGSSYGKYIKMNHPAAGLQSLYAHLSAQLVRVGQQVSRGAIIGLEGSTGGSTGPHLHFELGGGASAISAAGVSGSSSAVAAPVLPAWISNVISAPLDWLGDKVKGGLDSLKSRFGDNGLTGMIIGGAEKLVDMLGEKISDLTGGLIGGSATGAPMDVAGISGPVQAQVRAVAERYGWGSGAQWAALSALIQKESSWNPNAANPTSSARGLFQKMTSIHGAVEGSAAGQAAWGLNYIKGRYGSPAAALAFHNANNYYAEGGTLDKATFLSGQKMSTAGSSGIPAPGAEAAASSPGYNGTMMYDNGGYLPPGLTTVVNLTGKPEPVFTADQFAGMEGRGGSGETYHYEPHFEGSDLTPGEVANDIDAGMRKLRRGGKFKELR